MGRVAVLCHGWGGHDFYIWFRPLSALLQSHGISCVSPTFPEAKDPRYGPWRDMLLQILEDNSKDNEIYLVGHSMGGYLLLRFLAEFADSKFTEKIKGVLLVGGTATKRPEYKPFYDAEIQWDALRKVMNSLIVIWSKDDPIVGEEHVKLMMQHLSDLPGFTYIETDGYKHFVIRDLPDVIKNAAFELLNIPMEATTP